jgi:DNA-binding NtrC family response regulator
LPENLVEATLFGYERGAFTGAAQTTRGAFEQASGGTLLLDEIGELPLAAQAALLRTLESRQIQRVGSTTECAVDVRIVAATHQNLEIMVQQSRFRLDLFHRLNAVTLRLPPLRERADEIPALAEHILRSEEIPELAPRQLSKEAMELILRWSWPGNIRELRNVLERAAVVALGPLVEAEDLPEPLRGGFGDTRLQSAPTVVQPYGVFRSEGLGSPVLSSSSDALSGSAATMRQRLSAYEATLMRDALSQTGGHKARAAGLLNMPLRTFMKRLREFGL